MVKELNLNLINAPFETMKSNNLSPEIILRRAVIFQALLDLNIKMNKEENIKIYLESKKWIFGDSDDFYQICYEAKISPNIVRVIAKKIISFSKKNNFI